MAGLLDDLFEDLVDEKKEEKPGKEQDIPGGSNDQDNEDSDQEEDEGEMPSPLFPTGKDWEEFKSRRM